MEIAGTEVPIAVVVLIALFAFQSRGTAAVGRLFGRVMMLWFMALGAAGVYGIVRAPEILAALNPLHALAFITGDPVVEVSADSVRTRGGKAMRADFTVWAAGIKCAEVLKDLGQVGSVSRTGQPQPDRPGTFCIYVGGDWRRLELDERSIDRRDPIASLDVSLLQDRVLGPILGIGDPRTDKRIDFIGGIRGAGELQRRVDSGEMAIAFSLYPTTVDQLMAVSDAGRIMPPKSTWFEPKLRSGLFVHTL